jgi:hypothetical protein
MILTEYSGARGTLIHEKKLKSKISCQTPFKGIVYSQKRGVETAWYQSNCLDFESSSNAFM